MKEDPRSIHTAGGAYVEGDVHVTDGDFIGRDRIDITGERVTVQVYGPIDVDREAEHWRDFLNRNVQPYKGLASYTYEDRFLFTGRDEESDLVVRRIGQQQILVIYGAADVGKTSLLSAGVMPRLRQEGALVVLVPDYAQPLVDIRDRLIPYADQANLDLSPDQPLPDFAHALVTARQQGIVLILDQFERFFQPDVSAQERTALVDSLAHMLTTISPHFLRLVIAIREDARGRLDELEPHLPDLWRASVHLLPLKRQQAQQAIEYPLDRLTPEYPAFYADEIVQSRLLPDLIALAPQQHDRVLPAELQIVCGRLYQEARDRDTRRINESLYDEISHGKGAEGIMASHLDDTLHTALAGRQELARQILVAMVDPALNFWVAPAKLSLPQADLADVVATLNDMVRAQLLILRAVDGRLEYAFASHSVAQAARRLAGPEAQRRYQAEERLKLSWSAWLVDDALAGPEQLRSLARVGTHLEPRPVQVLFLLRSAVARDEPVQLWFSWLAEEPRASLVRQLEDPEDPAVRQPSSRTTLVQAQYLLGLRDERLPELPGHAPFGHVAWLAARHPDPARRETAALALAAAYGSPALDRLDQAMRTEDRAPHRRGRRAELRGALADADPHLEKENARLPLLDRLAIWWWRFRRRLIRDRRRLAGLTLGGAVGAGLGLGLLRALIAILAGDLLVGVQFALYFYWGAILGAALCLGMLLADALLLLRPGAADHAAAERTRRPPPILVVALGTLFFGLAQVVVAWLNGLSLARAPLVLPLGFLFGLGLSIALYGQPSAGWRVGVGRSLLRLGAAVAAAVLTQAVFILVEGKGIGITIAWPGTFYRSHFTDSVHRWLPGLLERSTNWFDLLGLLDAALVGAVLAIGITAGLILSADWLKKWRHLAYGTLGKTEPVIR
jgi:hypothetical protein